MSERFVIDIQGVHMEGPLDLETIKFCKEILDWYVKETSPRTPPRLDLGKSLKQKSNSQNFWAPLIEKAS